MSGMLRTAARAGGRAAGVKRRGAGRAGRDGHGAGQDLGGDREFACFIFLSFFYNLACCRYRCYCLWNCCLNPPLSCYFIALFT